LFSSGRIMTGASQVRDGDKKRREPGVAAVGAAETGARSRDAGGRSYIQPFSL
jgi:hypothetical protein